jgi:chloramphenicol-sensitive protein RarD
MQFLTAVYLFDEPMQTARLISFALIWLDLILYTVSARKKFATRK